MKIKLTESKLRQIVNESVRNILTEAKSLKRKGTIEMNGERIDATEDKLDRNGNPTYKVKHPSVKGRKDKNGYTRVRSYTFKPTNESLNKIVAESIKKVLKEGHWDDNVMYEWNKLVNLYGAEKFAWEVYRYLSTDKTEDLIKWFIRNIEADGDENYSESTSGFSLEDYWNDFIEMWGAEEFASNVIYKALNGKQIENIIESFKKDADIDDEEYYDEE